MPLSVHVLGKRSDEHHRKQKCELVRGTERNGVGMHMLRTFGVNCRERMTYKQSGMWGFYWRCVDMAVDNAAQWQHTCHEHNCYPAD